ncbi:MAG: 2-amino-4-hydroxy-6-hydroxymethyldihydropteridine diphosphokinase [Candidatus Aureabacteria bacterium]|nr:2-amino-4-hydroxy-6-hydroxymethyldihydropteridine diphosphokinase [Candidatus Auribacterota bacterium]
MPQAFVSVGSNINPGKNVRRAIRLLSCLVEITGISTVYRTQAESRPSQPPYYNCVIRIKTDVGPEDLKYRVLHGIEGLLGRRREKDKFSPRTIDLDLLLYGNRRIITPSLTVPDPEISTRPYLAFALQELQPRLRLPGSGVRIGTIASSTAPRTMAPLRIYTGFLRKEIPVGHKHRKTGRVGTRVADRAR